MISVIIVCKGSKEFVEQCMENVVTQRFDDFEYVIIDGGSTDGTIQRIRRYEAHLSYWHTMLDCNLAHAFNWGVERSSGVWLIFLNSDDFRAGREEDRGGTRPVVLKRRAKWSDAPRL